MDFIFMLTRGDKTVEDCLDVLEQIAPLELRHIGFKDVGVAPQTLKSLTDRIHAMGATSYMEVVSETPEACLNSACVARDLGVQRLLGGHGRHEGQGYPCRIGNCILSVSRFPFGSSDAARRDARGCRRAVPTVPRFQLRRGRSPCLSGHRRRSDRAGSRRPSGPRRRLPDRCRFDHLVRADQGRGGRRGRRVYHRHSRFRWLQKSTQGLAAVAARRRDCRLQSELGRHGGPRHRYRDPEPQGRHSRRRP
jgi:hypothetical protein